MTLRPLSVLALLTLAAGPTVAGEWWVDTESTEPDAGIDGDCRTASGECSLRAALDEAAAVAGDHLIHLPGGSYRPGRSWPANVALRGAGVEATSLEALASFDQPGRVQVERSAVSASWGLVVDGGTAVFSEVRLESLASGVGVEVISGRLELRDSEFVGPTADPGNLGVEWTGFLLTGGETIVDRCLVRGGDIEHSGAAGDTASVKLRSFEHLGGSLQIRNSTVLGNRATGSFDFGTAEASGLRSLSGAPLLLSHVTFEGSVANAVGDIGVPPFGTAATLVGGLSGPEAVVEHSVFLVSEQAHGEVVPVCIGQPLQAGPSWYEELDPACPTGSDPALVLGPGDPGLGEPAPNGGPTLTRHPAADSPLIDAGDPLACAAEDQRLAPRPVGASCDLGAVEVTCGGEGRDRDADGACDPDDICPEVDDPLQLDSDGDGHGDACDVCPALADPDQEDLDADGWGDACDGCPLHHDPSGLDTDADGLGDVCDCAPANPGEADARPRVVGDLRVTKTLGTAVRLEWTDPLAASGRESWAYDLAGGPIRAGSLSFGCVQADIPDTATEQGLGGNRWWSVRAETSCSGPWGQQRLDDSAPCP